MCDVIRYFKALSDETRLRLVHVLSYYELSVNELVSILEMGQSRVSRHLKILSEAGLLRSRRDGLWAFYSAENEGEGATFLKAVVPFWKENPVMNADVEMAATIIEERASKTRQFFNTIAEHWDTLSREVLGPFDLPEAVCKAMPDPCGVAVDLGCGTGSVLEKMYGKANLLIGVDGSARMLELSRRRFAALGDTASLSLRIGELNHLPLRDGEADFMSICMVLHHLSEPREALLDMRRVLRSGGRLVVVDFDRHTQERMRSDYGDLWLGFDVSSLEGLLQDAGFQTIEAFRHPVEQGLALNIVVAC